MGWMEEQEGGMSREKIVGDTLIETERIKFKLREEFLNSRVLNFGTSGEFPTSLDNFP